MRDAEGQPDAECRRGMRDSGEEGRGELERGPGSRTEWGGWRSRFRMPHSSRLSPLFHSKAPGLRDGLQPFLFERRYRNNATATSPTIFIDFDETLSIVSSSVW